MFNCDFPLALVFLPTSIDHSCIELEVAVKSPLLDGGFDILQYLCTACIEPAPIRIRIKWECLVDLSDLS